MRARRGQSKYIETWPLSVQLAVPRAGHPSIKELRPRPQLAALRRCSQQQQQQQRYSDIGQRAIPVVQMCSGCNQDLFINLAPLRHCQLASSRLEAGQLFHSDDGAAPLRVFLIETIPVSARAYRPCH